MTSSGRRHGSVDVRGPYYERDLIRLAWSRELESHEIGISGVGRWMSAREVSVKLATTRRADHAPQRRATAALPHVFLLLSLAVFVVAWPKLASGAIFAVRVVAAACALTIAYASEDNVERAPRWLFRFIGSVFAIPLGSPIGRGGWPILTGVLVFATCVHANALLDRIAQPSVWVTVAARALGVGSWILVMIVLGLFGLLDPRWSMWLR
jgi:hypothetical protein